MLDDLRSYLQMASGLTEATTTKAKEVVTSLLSQGMSLSTKAMPAPEMLGQVQELADDLVNTSRNNREMLVGMIRAEVDRAVGRMGFVREDELAALRRHVQRLEKQLADLEAAAPHAAPSYPAQTYPATSPAEAPAQPSATDVVEGSVDAPLPPSASEAAPEPATDAQSGSAAETGGEPEVPVKKKKKKIIVDETTGA